MCGRFTISKTKDDLDNYLNHQFQIEETYLDFDLPRYNICPSESIIAVLNDGTKYRAGLIKWGFSLSGKLLINARSETLNEKISFNDSFKYKRCIIISDGYYEWKNEHQNKLPIYIHEQNNNFMPMAGLWKKIQAEDGSTSFSCIIVTKQASDKIANIHHRMPVIFNDNHSLTGWLNPTITNVNYLNKLFINANPTLNYYQVSKDVNSPNNDCKDLLLPLY